MERGLHERIKGWVLGGGLYHGNKDIEAMNMKVSTRDDDNFLFSIQVKKPFLKKELFLQARWAAAAKQCCVASSEIYYARVHDFVLMSSW